MTLLSCKKINKMNLSRIEEKEIITKADIIELENRDRII
jgi:hypothetical protein